MAMDNAVAPKARDGDGLQWLDISDFSMGCVSNDIGSIQQVQFTGIQPQGNKIAAEAGSTFGCMALPTGGLGALPGLSNVYTWPGSLHSINGYLVGMFAHGNLGGATEVVAAMEQDNGTNHYLEVYSYIPGSGSHSILSTTNPTTPGFFATPYMAMTRVALSSPTTTVGNPTVFFPWSCATDANGNSGHLYLYPNPSTPTTYSVLDLVTAGSNVTGPAVAHQGRIITLSGISYQFPPSSFQTNEQICYTDPPNSTVYGFQQEILVPEHPYGYGGVGSIQASELFLIKQREGAVLATGDIANTQVTYLPGVQSTGPIYGQVGQTPIGLVYCSQNKGAWVWNGGSTSQKISGNIYENFFAPATGVPSTQNLGYYVTAWGNWILFSNSWIYDITTGGWWRLYPGADTENNYTSLTEYDFFFFSMGATENLMYAGMPTIAHTSEKWLASFDNTMGTTQYQWQSLPIQLSDNRSINLRQIVIRTVDPLATGSATIEVMVSTPNLSSPTFSQTTTAGQITQTPTNMVFNFTSGPVDNIVLTIVATNSGSEAPIINSISLGYQTREHSATLG
jgi:hypothetical protein